MQRQRVRRADVFVPARATSRDAPVVVHAPLRRPRPLRDRPRVQRQVGPERRPEEAHPSQHQRIVAEKVDAAPRREVPPACDLVSAWV